MKETMKSSLLTLFKILGILFHILQFKLTIISAKRAILIVKKQDRQLDTKQGQDLIFQCVESDKHNAFKEELCRYNGFQNMPHSKIADFGLLLRDV